MNLDRYNALDDSLREALDATIDEMTTYQRERSQQLEGEILDKFADQGVTVTEITPEQKELWRDAAVEADIYSLVKSKMEHPEYLDELLKP